MTLNNLNSLSYHEAYSWFEQTCAAKHWIEAMVNARPYSDLDSLTEHAAKAWQGCEQEDFLEAFTAHPMIGDVATLRAKFANTKAVASGEQSGTAGASEETLHALKALNEAYLDKHGFIFIICATGLSADTMLNALKARLPNSTEQEIRIAAQEQIKITLLRINKALNNNEAQNNPERKK
ncbi:2-oxo-4-hydroxy-4-carboxy-5-ureidoimidazoline decarboxylase [Alteromonas sp. 345S023]|uniref:2-oxo-4-hydroxy-4-carboxy-5-ureidoimidazoline decarboxylase n=1 Tax=Alteromonas profundi TaxID=2696062 RepID=A0A7X5RJQ3_9ALTE|nr:2-oxo-4-hydroxy-4-carboxy-5-ureidoimidazoline decarboxylase [Alteromonas profundi]NDV89911.1 2-oxo-4-hydroxy-4-carboxy-5-ureidoimidazoline decarboxylase [Alteromonas profundi]